jgi:hypothetical protein
MKIGVLATGWDCAEYFNQVLEPWLQYREKHDDLIISAASGQFREYENSPQANIATKELMLHAFNTKKIDYVAFPIGDFDEAGIRNIALSPLLQEKVDYIILLDFDEIYTLEQIEKIFQFVEQNPFTAWFKINFKNYVGDKNHYVADFSPPRIFKAENLAEFYYDNDINYYIDGGKVSYKNFSSLQVPRNQAFVKHYSWCGSPERLKSKIDYQLKHFNGICSYKWNNKKNKIELDLDFYKKYKLPVPQIYDE